MKKKNVWKRAVAAFFFCFTGKWVYGGGGGGGGAGGEAYKRSSALSAHFHNKIQSRASLETKKDNFAQNRIAKGKLAV